MADKTDFTVWLQGQFALIPDQRAATVARMAGIEPGYVSALRTGKKKRPRWKVVKAIARAIAELRQLDSAATAQLVEEGLRAAGLAPTASEGSTTTASATPICKFEVIISIAIYQK